MVFMIRQLKAQMKHFLWRLSLFTMPSWTNYLVQFVSRILRNLNSFQAAPTTFAKAAWKTSSERSQNLSAAGTLNVLFVEEKLTFLMGGISKIPTNTLIVRMLERASIPRAQQEIKHALKRSKEKIEAL